MGTKYFLDEITVINVLCSKFTVVCADCVVHKVGGWSCKILGLKF